MGETDPVAQLRATGVAAYLGVAGLVSVLVWAYLLLALATAAVGAPSPVARQVLSAVALGLGTATVAGLYLRGSGRGRAFVDVAVPDRGDLLVAVAGSVALFAVLSALDVAFSTLGVSTAEHGIEAAARAGDPEILLAMVPAALLLIGPGEELLYRNVIQKSLYGAFPRWRAVVVASGVFALAHIPAYAVGASSGAAVAATLAVIFVLSVLLGVAYERTGNVVVPALIHGAYDAVLFVYIYVQIA